MLCAPVPIAAAASDGAAETVVDVTDFGADPTGKQDSAAAVAQAMRHAKTRCLTPAGGRLLVTTARHGLTGPDPNAGAVLSVPVVATAPSATPYGKPAGPAS
ncbi:hypothetical protein ACFWOJ_36905 [Streptomyces sp. NPDC058439]|uniref:hypothetical protein n=1 Tax=Streptomyces sp. NPDC058439 TaxID=3346500 RepID=UPI0036678D21